MISYCSTYIIDGEERSFDCTITYTIGGYRCDMEIEDVRDIEEGTEPVTGELAALVEKLVREDDGVIEAICEHEWEMREERRMR